VKQYIEHCAQYLISMWERLSLNRIGGWLRHLSIWPRLRSGFLEKPERDPVRWVDNNYSTSRWSTWLFTGKSITSF